MAVVIDISYNGWLTIAIATKCSTNQHVSKFNSVGGFGTSPSSKLFSSINYRPRKLRWQWKNNHLKMYPWNVDGSWSAVGVAFTIKSNSCSCKSLVDMKYVEWVTVYQRWRYWCFHWHLQHWTHTDCDGNNLSGLCLSITLQNLQKNPKVSWTWFSDDKHLRIDIQSSWSPGQLREKVWGN